MSIGIVPAAEAKMGCLFVEVASHKLNVAVDIVSVCSCQLYTGVGTGCAELFEHEANDTAYSFRLTLDMMLPSMQGPVTNTFPAEAVASAWRCCGSQLWFPAICV